MELTGKELEFISQINRDGTGTIEVTKNHIDLMNDTKFEVSCLSLSEKTFIASGFNSFVVKIKPPKPKEKKMDSNKWCFFEYVLSNTDKKTFDPFWLTEAIPLLEWYKKQHFKEEISYDEIIKEYNELIK